MSSVLKFANYAFKKGTKETEKKRRKKDKATCHARPRHSCERQYVSLCGGESEYRVTPITQPGRCSNAFLSLDRVFFLLPHTFFSKGWLQGTRARLPIGYPRGFRCIAQETNRPSFEKPHSPHVNTNTNQIYQFIYLLIRCQQKKSLPFDLLHHFIFFFLRKELRKIAKTFLAPNF